MAPTAVGAPPAGPAPIIQLRLSTRAAERLEALLEGGNGDGGGLRAVIDESGGE
jgi:hypothetical protein